MRKSSARQFLHDSVATALRRLRGPLPEVSEVPWSEWEDTVAAWDGSDTGPPTQDPGVTVSDADWATWAAVIKAGRGK